MLGRCEESYFERNNPYFHLSCALNTINDYTIPAAMAATTATTPLKTPPRLLLAPGEPAFPNPDATVFVCDALAMVGTIKLVGAVPIALLPALVTCPDPFDEVVVAFALAVAVVCGATSPKIEEVLLKNDVVVGTDLLLADVVDVEELVEDFVVEDVVRGGQVRRECESVSRAMARK